MADIPIAPFYFIRHARTRDNVEERLTSQGDYADLDEVGMGQAFHVADSLRGKGIVAVFSSDLRRAMNTANWIKQATGAPVFRIRPYLREVNVGKMTGLLRKEAYEQFADGRFRTMHPQFDFGPIGGENRRLAVNRQLAVLREARNELGADRPIAFVGHGSSLRILLEYLGDPLPMHRQGGYSELVVREIPRDMAD